MKRAPAILFGLLLVAFAAGLLHVLRVRFARGDIYPPASTFRADPLGARAFHDALAQVTSVRRHLRSFASLGDARGRTLFLLGADHDDLRMTATEFKALQAFVADGGRLVFALQPGSESSRDRFNDEPDDRGDDPFSRRLGTRPSTNAPARKQPRVRPPGDPEETDEPALISVAAEWQFALETQRAADRSGEVPEFTVSRRIAGVLPAELQWHGAAWFQVTNAAWRTLYAAEPQRPVALERRVGRGTVVLLSDSWHFTNEAMRADRQPAWLAWLVGPQRGVIFDETHLGIREEPGVATLARRYRLHGVFVALVALAALFIWRNSTSFPPIEAATVQAGVPPAVAGREAAAGFVSLLRRNLPVAGLAQTCLDEWRRSCARATPPARLQAVEAAFADAAASNMSASGVTSLYRKLSQILKRSASKP